MSKLFRHWSLTGWFNYMSYSLLLKDVCYLLSELFPHEKIRIFWYLIGFSNLILILHRGFLIDRAVFLSLNYNSTAIFRGLFSAYQTLRLSKMLQKIALYASKNFYKLAFISKTNDSQLFEH